MLFVILRQFTFPELDFINIDDYGIKVLLWFIIICIELFSFTHVGYFIACLE